VQLFLILPRDWARASLNSEKTENQACTYSMYQGGFWPPQGTSKQVVVLKSIRQK
jgi:hypothetical protein